MNRPRMKHMLEILERVEPKHFDLSSWAWRPREAPPFTCATTACAIGHAAGDPEFQAQGLKLVQHPSEPWRGVPVYEPAGRDYPVDGWCAVLDFFEINEGQASYLFDPGSYWEHHRRSPSEVARRIRKVLGLDPDLPPQES